MYKLLSALIFLLSFYNFSEGQTLIPGTIGSNQSICYGSAPKALVQIIAPTGGTGSYSFQWQRSNDNRQTWSNITRATQSAFFPPVLGKSAWFRRMVSDGSSFAYSNEIEISVLPNLTAGILNNSPLVCYGATPAALNGTLSGGGSGIINHTYQWQSSGDGYYWSDISGANSTSYSPSSMTNDTWFRRLVKDEACGTTASNSVKVTMYASVNSAKDSLFRSQIPNDDPADVLYDLGSEFEILANGIITKARLYTWAHEDGLHVIRLWHYTGSGYALSAGPYNWDFPSGFQGWREFEFPVPIVVAAGRYIISITNGPDKSYAQRLHTLPQPGNYLKYIGGLYTANIGQVPNIDWNGSTYFRDIVFYTDNNGFLTPGSIGSSQSICYNSIPASIEQLTSPYNGQQGEYIFQWQSSPDNNAWINISGADQSNYSPEALTQDTYFRRAVSSGSFCTVYSNSVKISIFSQPVTQAELHDDIVIFNNTSTNLKLNVTGGTSPYTFYYTINGIDPTPVYNYSSGTDFSTGVLSSGTHVFSVVSVSDADNCITNTQAFDVPVNVTVIPDNVDPVPTNKALVLVNSSETNYYNDYTDYIKPYLDHFGIPCDVFNVNGGEDLPAFSNYALIIFGHNNVYDGVTLPYPLSDLQSAINNGVGLYSFDPHLFDYASSFNSILATPINITANHIDINPDHFITNLRLQGNGNDGTEIALLNSWNLTQKSNLINGVVLAQMTNDFTISLLQVSTYGDGRIVKWSGYDWVKETIKGPVYGMDDLIWRGIVWAARKPFVMNGIPPILTMRVDDATGNGVMNNFEWVDISNESGFVPWGGLFIREIFEPAHIAKLKSLIDNNKMTAAPHAFFAEDYPGPGFIYFNHGNLVDFDAAARTIQAKSFFNDFAMSKYLIAHYYEIGSQALEAIQEIGIEFLGVLKPPDNPYEPLSPWLNCGPYRINRNGVINNFSSRPFYYGGNVTWNYNGTDYSFFNCLTEPRDLNGYDWYPSNDVSTSVIIGTNFLRRALNSLVLPTLFTHWYYLDDVTASNWRSILTQITNTIESEYDHIEYRSMDYAVQYLRARSNLTVTNVNVTPSNIIVSYSGNNDMDTRCYLFTEDGNGDISYRFITLPKISGQNSVCVSR